MPSFVIHMDVYVQAVESACGRYDRHRLSVAVEGTDAADAVAALAGALNMLAEPHEEGNEA